MRSGIGRGLVHIGFLLALLLPFAGDLNASTKVTVTAPDGFADGIVRVAIVTMDCAPQLDCPDVVHRVTTTIRTELKLALKIADETAVRKALFELGATEYDASRREALAKALSVDAFLEISIPFAERGDGYGGRHGSESKVEVRLVKTSGEILMAGTGFGRPMNVVTSPERVADRTIKEILEQAFKKK